MAIQLDFSGAEAQRLRITQEQQEQIRDLYRQASAEVGKLAEQAPRVPSDAVRQQYLHTLQKQIDDQLRDIERQLNGTIRSSMTDTVKATVTDAKAFLKENGLPINGAYSHVPADIVRSVASGQLYTGNWTLSRALWLNTAETQHDVQSVIAQGIIQNKSAFDIAKDLEKYVNPDASKDWEWSRVYPGTKKVVDYNAQRLARTMVSHAYQQAFVRTTQKNPFVTKYKWEASNSGRVCEICEERDGKLFDKDDLPLDHPNGMCTFTAVMDNLDIIGERLGDWAAGKPDPELDKWAEDLYGKGWEKAQQDQNPYIHMTKDEYASWQEENATSNTIYSSFEKEFGVTLSGNTLLYKDDRYIEDGPYAGMWLSDILDQRVEAINTVTKSYGCGYVQNADGSRCINTYWRTGSAKDLLYRKSEIEETSKALDLLIQSSTVNREVYVDRWAGASSLERMGIHVTGEKTRIGHAHVTSMNPQDIVSQIQQNLIGAVIEDKAYMSASMQSDLNVFRGSDIKYSIQVPKGTHAYITDNTRESEVIFGKGTKQEILGARVIQAEAYDYEGKATLREVVEITVRILPE